MNVSDAKAGEWDNDPMRSDRSAAKVNEMLKAVPVSKR